jgi:hypothetical protein
VGSVERDSIQMVLTAISATARQTQAIFQTSPVLFFAGGFGEL